MSCEYAALTDDERRLMDTIEADLDREMAVEPSADFAARVRARISEPEPNGGWSVPWRFAAAAVLTIATGLLLASWRGGPAGMDSPAIATGHDVALPAPSVPAPIVATSRPPDARSVRIPSRQTAIAPVVEPEVLVPPDLRLAIGRVMEMVRAGTLNERTFPAPTPARTERAPGAAAERTAATGEEPVEPLAAMVVEELQVPPINAAGGGVEKGFGLD
jgi:hypothetical protein